MGGWDGRQVGEGAWAAAAVASANGPSWVRSCKRSMTKRNQPALAVALARCYMRLEEQHSGKSTRDGKVMPCRQSRNSVCGERLGQREQQCASCGAQVSTTRTTSHIRSSPARAASHARWVSRLLATSAARGRASRRPYQPTNAHRSRCHKCVHHVRACAAATAQRGSGAAAQSR